ncbi:MAG: hypothetical protein ACFFAN_16520 [Promethearchaeota archaeon]
MREFKVNEYITRKLEDDKTITNVAGERFMQCKSLLLNILVKKIHSFDEIESIDLTYMTCLRAIAMLTIVAL